ncbi:MAG: hypothetical protein ABEI96_05245 [Haloarculaceae archaeon]
MRAVAINVGANTNDPGFRGPVFPDGRFAFVPIPESEPTREPTPTYGDLEPHLPLSIPEAVRDRPVHLDPEFAGYPRCDRYTYGDPHGVKARPLLDLDAGDYVLFYATLTTAAASPRVDCDDSPADWQAPAWGAYLVGHFRLARAPLSGEDYRTLSAADREPFATNAHVGRDPFDARVLLLGESADSRLYDRAVPLSSRTAGADANRLVTHLSTDSGNGPWWRRPLRFESDAAATVLATVRERRLERCFDAP